MERSESTKRAELEKLQQDEEKLRIESAEKERLLKLDIRLARLEALAQEERIATIQGQVTKLERLNDETGVILEKLGVKVDTPPAAKTPSSTESTPKRTTPVMKTAAPAVTPPQTTSDGGGQISTTSPAIGAASVAIVAGSGNCCRGVYNE